MAIKKITGNGVAESDMDIKKALTLSPCTCIADKEMTCIVHPTTRSLKDRIAELEKEQAAWRKFTNEANRTLDAADKKIAEQQQTIDRKDERIAELEAKIRRREAALDSFDAVERARQAENAKLQEQLAEEEARSDRAYAVMSEQTKVIAKLREALQEIAYSDHLANLWSRIKAAEALLGGE